jgi:hypothetical protein
MAKKNNPTNQQTKSVSEQKTGYGDKKLEGPNRPAE